MFKESGEMIELASRKLNVKDKYHQQLNSEEETSIANTIELQNEVDHLKMQVK